MLAVSMKEAGILQIGNVTLYIREIRGNQVRISVMAPQEMKIEHLEPVPGLEAGGTEVVMRNRMGRR